MKKALAIAAACFLQQLAVALGESHVGFETEKVDKRLVVSSIYEASMAMACGIREGDAILAIGTVPVRTSKDVVRLTSKKKVGEWVPVKVQRKEFVHTFNVTLVDADDMRSKSQEAARARKDASEKKFFQEQKDRAEVEAAAIAADPDLPARLEQLLDEYEIISQSDATWLQKAIHCDRIADCYLKLRNKDAFKHWKTQAAIHRQPPMTTGRTSWP
jgi:hypothetical protein